MRKLGWKKSATERYFFAFGLYENRSVTSHISLTSAMCRVYCSMWLLCRSVLVNNCSLHDDGQWRGCNKSYFAHSFRLLSSTSSSSSNWQHLTSPPGWHKWKLWLCVLAKKTNVFHNWSCDDMYIFSLFFYVVTSSNAHSSIRFYLVNQTQKKSTWTENKILNNIFCEFEGKRFLCNKCLSCKKKKY